jgi:hypothetical protein
MRAARLDANQKEIDETATAAGCCIVRASLAPNLGFDRLYIHQGRMLIVEVKNGALPPSGRKLTDNETKTRAAIVAAGGEYHVVESADDLLRLLGRA